MTSTATALSKLENPSAFTILDNINNYANVLIASARASPELVRTPLQEANYEYYADIHFSINPEILDHALAAA